MAACSSSDSFIPTNEEIEIESMIKRGYEPCHNCRPGIMDLVFISKSLSLFELPLWKLHTNQKALHCQHCKFTIPFIDITKKIGHEDQNFPIDDADTTDPDKDGGSFGDKGCGVCLLDIIQPVPSLGDCKPIVPPSKDVKRAKAKKVIDVYGANDDFHDGIGLAKSNHRDHAPSNSKMIFVIEDNDYVNQQPSLPIHCPYSSTEDRSRMMSSISTPCDFLYRELIIITDNDEHAILSSRMPAESAYHDGKEIIAVSEDDEVIDHVYEYTDVDPYAISGTHEDIPSLITSSSTSGKSSKHSSHYYPMSIDASQYGLSPWKVFSI